MHLLLLIAILHEPIWGGAFRLPVLSRRVWAGFFLFVPFMIVFGWQIALIVTLGAALRRYKGWRPPWMGGEVILYMNNWKHVASMFALSLCLLLTPALGMLLGLPFAWEIYVIAAALIALVYWINNGLLNKIHHNAEWVTGAIIVGANFIHFQGLVI